MAEVEWIKLMVDMFDNPKVKNIRRMPEGNNIVLIWVMLLTMAGRCNANGLIYLTQDISYTLEALADELRFSGEIIKLAFQVLEQHNMIGWQGDMFYIKNWEEYQNVEGMEKIRMQNKERQKRFRERQKIALLAENSVTDSVTVTQHNAIEEDKEKDIDIKKENKNSNKGGKGVFQEFAGEDKDLLEALREFNNFRNLKKKPMTDEAKKRLVNKLSKEFPKDQWIAILHQSIDKGWTDIYDLKGDDNYNSSGYRQKQSLHTDASQGASSSGSKWGIKYS